MSKDVLGEQKWIVAASPQLAHLMEQLVDMLYEAGCEIRGVTIGGIDQRVAGYAVGEVAKIGEVPIVLAVFVEQGCRSPKIPGALANKAAAPGCIFSLLNVHGITKSS